MSRGWVCIVSLIIMGPSFWFRRNKSKTLVDFCCFVVVLKILLMYLIEFNSIQRCHSAVSSPAAQALICFLQTSQYYGQCRTREESIKEDSSSRTRIVFGLLGIGPKITAATQHCSVGCGATFSREVFCIAPEVIDALGRIHFRCFCRR